MNIYFTAAVYKMDYIRHVRVVPQFKDQHYLGFKNILKTIDQLLLTYIFVRLRQVCII